MHNMLFAVSVLCLAILLLKRLQQPYLIAYVAAGILLGPHVSGIFPDSTNTAALGEIGILLLMFFLGMEINIPDSRSQLRKPAIAQGIKMLLLNEPFSYRAFQGILNSPFSRDRMSKAEINSPAMFTVLHTRRKYFEY